MDKFDIRVLRFDDAPGKDPVTDLARVFGIDQEMARQVVARAPVLVKRGVTEAQAEELFHLLRTIGAEVRIETASATRQTVGPPPSIPMPSSATDPQDPLGLRPMPPLPVPDFGATGVPAPAPPSIRPMAPAPVGDASSVRPPPAPSVRPAPGSMRPAAGSMRPGAPRSIAPPAGDKWHCNRCNVSFFEHQVRAASNLPDRLGMAQVFVCPRCQQAVTPITGERAVPLTRRLLGAFTYPVQKSAPVVFIGVALIATLFALIPFIGVFFMVAILATFYFSVIKVSAAGRDELPSKEEASDLFNLFGPLFRFYAAIVAPYLPAVFLTIYMPESAAKMPVIALAFLVGLIYMPASMMIAVLSPSCLGPFNPVAGFMIMTRVPGSYALTTFAVAAALGMGSLVDAGVAATLGEIPFLGLFLMNLAGMPFTVIAARMLGLFLHHHEAELGLD